MAARPGPPPPPPPQPPNVPYSGPHSRVPQQLQRLDKRNNVDPTISQDRSEGKSALEAQSLAALDRVMEDPLRPRYNPVAPPNSHYSHPRGPPSQPLPPPVIITRPKRTGRPVSDSSEYSSDSDRRPRKKAQRGGARVTKTNRIQEELEDEVRMGCAPMSLDTELPDDEAQMLHMEATARRFLTPLKTEEKKIFCELFRLVEKPSSRSCTNSSFNSREGTPAEDIDLQPTNTSLTLEQQRAQVSDLLNQAIQYRILNQIDCHDSRPLDKHFALFYEDTPQKSFDSGITARHLSAHYPVPDVEEYLDNCRQEQVGLGFIVLRKYGCDDQGNHAPRLRPTSWPKIKRHRLDGSLGYDEIIKITSEALYDSIMKVSTYDPVVLQNTEYSHDNWSLLDLKPPHVFLYHHRRQLTELAEKSLDKITRDQILALVSYVQTVYGARFEEADELIGSERVNKNTLQFLLRPNEIVISHDEQKDAPIARVFKRYLDSEKVLSCWSWEYDGSQLIRLNETIYLHAGTFNESAPIRSLETYPINYAPENLRLRLIARGQKFWSLRNQHYVSYTGWDGLKEDYHHETRCMIDYRTYRKMHPGNNQSSITIMTRFERPATRQSDNVIEEDFLLMPFIVHGFVLQDKKWVKLYVDRIGSINWNKEAFERLVLPPRTKDLVKALVMVRASSKKSKLSIEEVSAAKKREDVIAGKGKGLIVLLHGSPGTGKTLTAESVAEIAEMPLYRVTCGDMGTDAKAVEEYLRGVLYLANIWNCVLLLDEADVFLEERTLSDLDRNSLVSVFLRILEYYEGILILTSNRVGTFDEAFRSRMQLALHYPTLSPTARRTIWQNFFELLEKDGDDLDLDEIKLHLDELANQEMNGREIRNALMTARQLASFKNETLTWDHVQSSIKTASDFTKYLKNVHGHTDEQWAREERLR